jgi:hypothetical protein
VLHPTHGRGRLIGIDVLGTPRHDALAVLEVGCKHTRDGLALLLLTLRVRRAVALACAVKTGEIRTRARDQGGEASDEVQRFQHDLRRSIAKRLLVAVHDPAQAIHRQALGRGSVGG